MRITLIFPLWILCIAFAFSVLPTQAPAVDDEGIVVAGCPAGKIDCPKPKSSSSDRKKGGKGKKKG